MLILQGCSSQRVENSSPSPRSSTRSSSKKCWRVTSTEFFSTRTGADWSEKQDVLRPQLKNPWVRVYKGVIPWAYPRSGDYPGSGVGIILGEHIQGVGIILGEHIQGRGIILAHLTVLSRTSQPNIYLDALTIGRGVTETR